MVCSLTHRQERRLGARIEGWVNEMIQVTRIDQWGNALARLLVDWANNYGIIFTKESLDAVQYWMAREQDLALEERELAEGRRFHEAMNAAAKAAAEEQGLDTESGTLRFQGDLSTGEFVFWDIGDEAEGHQRGYVESGETNAIDPYGLAEFRFTPPDFDGKSRVGQINDAGDDRILLVVVDGEIKWSLFEEWHKGHHSGMSADFDYKWLKRNSGGSITFRMLDSKKIYTATYKPTPAAHFSPTQHTLDYALIENMGLHNVSVEGLVEYTYFTIQGKNVVIEKMALQPAVFETAMEITAYWTYNSEAGDGAGLLFRASSPFGTNKKLQKGKKTEGKYTPPPSISGDGRKPTPAMSAQDDQKVTMVSYYWALQDKWFVRTKGNDAETASSVDVSTALLVNTGVGIGASFTSGFKLELPGRPSQRVGPVPRPGK